MFGLLAYRKAMRIRREIHARSVSTDPAGLTLSDARLKRLCPSLYLTSGVAGLLRGLLFDGLSQRVHIREILLRGGSRAAVVLHARPLVVACYCEGSDAVCLLEFREDVCERRYREGDRLLAMQNVFIRLQSATGEIAPDLVLGDRGSSACINFWPLVAEFLSDDFDAIERRKAAIPDDEFERCWRLGEEHRKRFPGQVRDGRPDLSGRPAI